MTNNSTTVNYTYDANGNVTNDGTHTYAYDSENRVVSIDSGAATYAYDYQNRRYKKTVGSTVTHYVWEGGKVLGEYNGSTGANQALYWYLRDRLFKKTGTTPEVLLSDQLSVRLTLSNIGAITGRQGHLSFGEDFAESGSQQKQHFTSYERNSEAGTDHALNRQYSQSVGRFNRPDPASKSYDPGNPQSLNRYSYVKNDPVGSVDPSGLDDIFPDPFLPTPTPNNPNPYDWDNSFWWGGNPYNNNPDPINPNYAEAYFGLGKAYNNLSRYKEASEALRKSISIKPDYAEAYCLLGFIYLNDDKFEDGHYVSITEEDARVAKEALLQATKIKPEYIEAYTGLGLAYELLNQKEEAMQAFNQAVILNPDNYFARFMLGIIYVDLGNKEAAVQQYERLKYLADEESKHNEAVGFDDNASVVRMYAENLLKKMKESLKEK